MRAEMRIGSVGEPLLHAHLGVEQAVVAAAENSVHHFHGNRFGSLRRIPSFPTRICVCTASGLSISQMCWPEISERRRRRGDETSCFGHAPKYFSAAAKASSGRDVARKGEQRLVRRVVRVVEFRELVAIQFLRGFRSAFARPAIGRAAVDDAREDDGSEIVGIGILHGQSWREAAGAGDRVHRRGTPGAGQRRTSNRVRDSNPSSRRRASPWLRPCPAEALSEPPTKSIASAISRADRFSVPCVSMFAVISATPGLSRGILDASRRHDQEPRRHGGFAVIGDDENAQAVRQRFRGGVREIERLRRPGRRHLRARASRPEEPLLCRSSGFVFCARRACGSRGVRLAARERGACRHKRQLEGASSV